MTHPDCPAVLHVTAPAEFGGLERVVAALARGMHRRERRVHVLAFVDVGSVDHPLVQELREAGVPATGVEVPSRAYRFERAALRRVASETGACLVHTHGARVDVVDLPAARRLGLTTVSTLHGFTGGGWKNRLYEWLQVRAARRCDGVVAVSRCMAERLRREGVPPGRLHVIPNAWFPRRPPLPRLEARNALGVPAEGLRIGWVGRLTCEKGADVLLDAVALLEDLPISVSIVGSGSDQAALSERARAKGIAARITWHGAVPDAARLMGAFDLFALTSRTEGTPIVLFEAMAAGSPLVVTAVGGVPDVVTPREAHVVPAENPAALAAAIRDVCSNAAAARSRVLAARARLSERFGLDPWLDAYEQLYLAAHLRGGPVKPLGTHIRQGKEIT